MANQGLFDRLTSQLATKGVANPRGEARSILVARGHMHPNGELTAEGQKREALGADGRAKDRASKLSGHSPDEYKYSSKTNRVKLK